MNILRKPVITEKMTAQGDKFNRYGFMVDKKSNKIQIRKAVEDMYNVTVESVNTMNYKGNDITRYTKRGVIQGRTKSFKKAIVTLTEGDEIDFYSNI